MFRILTFNMNVKGRLGKVPRAYKNEGAFKGKK
jgi:hypothetical protein